MDRHKEILAELMQFTEDRDWDQFHDSKNLALAISIEAAELNELFLWKKGCRGRIKWPVVYLIEDDQLAYVGETTNISIRLQCYLKSEEKSSQRIIVS